MFKPKVNVNYDNNEQLNGHKATVALHLRDLPMGEVVLNADYVDLYEPVDSSTYGDEFKSDDGNEMLSEDDIDW